MEDLGGFLVRRRGLAGGRGELGETIGDEEDEVDEETVRGALDLKVPEKTVCSEQVQRLVNDIWLSWVGGQGCGPPDLCGDREDGGVADLPDGGVLVECGMVCLWAVSCERRSLGDLLAWYMAWMWESA